MNEHNTKHARFHNHYNKQNCFDSLLPSRKKGINTNKISFICVYIQSSHHISIVLDTIGAVLYIQSSHHVSIVLDTIGAVLKLLWFLSTCNQSNEIRNKAESIQVFFKINFFEINS